MLPYNFIWTPFRPDLDQSILEVPPSSSDGRLLHFCLCQMDVISIRHAHFEASRAEQQRRHGRQGGRTEQFCLLSSRNAHFEASRAGRRRRRQGRQSRQGRQTEQTGVQQRPRWDATGQVKRMKALGARTTIFVVLGGSQRSNHCNRRGFLKAPD